MKKRRHVNIFKEAEKENFRVTDHFLKRWNERVEGPKFDARYELEDYVRYLYENGAVYHIDSDCYLIDDIMVISALDKESIVFITTYGSRNENHILFNILLDEGVKGVRQINRKYGKFNLEYAV